jgi:hypothetical protein
MATTSQLFFFLSSGMADHALRLGPYKRISSEKKIPHGHRWSHAVWQSTTQKTRNKPENSDTQVPQPDMRIAVQEKQQSKQRKGQGPTKTPTQKCCHTTQW